MTEEKIEELAEKYRLGTWHQIVSTFGIPIILVMGSIIGALISMQVSDLKQSVSAALDLAQKNQTNIAVLDTRSQDHDRRIASLEDWRGAFMGYERADRQDGRREPPSNYIGKNR